MADRILLEAGTDGYQLEDGSGVLILRNTFPIEAVEDSPTVYLRLGEPSGTFVDTMVGNDGTASGTPTRDVANTALATDDGGVSFPTTSDFITVADGVDVDLGDGPFSLEFWGTRTSDSGSTETAFHKGADGYGVGIGTGGAFDDKLILYKSGVQVLFHYTSTVPADGSWHHYVITRSAAGTGNTLIYVDAVEGAVADNAATTLSDTALSLEIGREGAAQRWRGAIDELLIYKSVLSPVRVAEHYAARTVTSGGAPANAPAELAAGTGAAANAAASVAPNAGNATGTGAASAAAPKVAPNAGSAGGTGTAFGVTTTIRATAGVAAGTGAAGTPTPSVKPNAGHAAGTGQAFDATVSAVVETNAPAGHAAGTGAAAGVSASVAPHAGNAAGTGAAHNPSTSIKAPASAATGTGQAFDATVSTATMVNAAAGHAAGTGAAFNAGVSVKPSAGVAAGTGTAFGGAGWIVIAASGATGTGAAFDATISTSGVGVADASVTLLHDAVASVTGSHAADASTTLVHDSTAAVTLA